MPKYGKRLEKAHRKRVIGWVIVILGIIISVYGMVLIIQAQGERREAIKSYYEEFPTDFFDPKNTKKPLNIE